MKVLAHLGPADELGAGFEDGKLCVFEQSGEGFQKLSEASFSLAGDLSICEVRKRFKAAIEAVGECDVAALSDLRGVLPALLEDAGCHVHQTRGSLQEQLSAAVQQELLVKAEEEAREKNRPAPIAIGPAEEGVYRFDLLEALAADTCHVSYDLLLPFLETVSFRRLELVCDHLPKWIHRELIELGMVFEVVEEAKGTEPMLLHILAEDEGWTRPVGKRPQRKGCSC